jgi:S-adenosylmethionine hydrolase
LITNIESKQVNTLTGNFEELTIYMAHHILKGIAQSYSERNAGEPLAIIGSRDLLEVAVNKRHAASILDCKKGDEVRLMLSSG